MIENTVKNVIKNNAEYFLENETNKNQLILMDNKK